jgi:hypothetical protein
MTGTVLPFPDRSAILVDRTSDGRWCVEPFLCPLAAGKGRVFDHGGDAIDYAEALAIETGAGWCLLCEP